VFPLYSPLHPLLISSLSLLCQPPHKTCFTLLFSVFRKRHFSLFKYIYWLRITGYLSVPICCMILYPLESLFLES
jgi:hypothetical protein